MAGSNFFPFFFVGRLGRLPAEVTAIPLPGTLGLFTLGVAPVLAGGSGRLVLVFSLSSYTYDMGIPPI